MNKGAVLRPWPLFFKNKMESLRYTRKGGVSGMNLIETRGISKCFGDFYANKEIDLAVEQGEIRAIIGENGAGKTTLMNMLYGMLEPTEGEIRLNGKAVRFHSPKDAIRHGLGMVHQHFKLVPSLTVFENIMLGAELTYQVPLGKNGKGLPLFLINRKKERAVIEALIKQYRFDLCCDDLVEDISVGARQRVEILKMLYRNVDLLIFDEPTSVLTPQEVEELIENLLELKRQGKTIIIITHKLAEVKQLSDTISVMRRGKLVGTVETDAVTEEELAQMMVGRKVLLKVDKGENDCTGRPVRYSVEGLTVKDSRGKPVVSDISFSIRQGEVLGIAGVEGNGQSELVAVLTGMMVCDSGRVMLDGKELTNAWPDTLRQVGVGIVPEDRYAQGLCSEMTIAQNLIAGYHAQKPVCKGLFFDKKEILHTRDALVEQYDIRLSEKNANVSSLSGGNAQKIIIAREMHADPVLLIACQPTRGVDIGSIEFIHRKIIELRDAGKAVLLVSSELSEVMGLSDRLIVLYKGEQVGEFPADSVTPAELGLYMIGSKRQAASKAANCSVGGGDLRE